MPGIRRRIQHQIEREETVYRPLRGQLASDSLRNRIDAPHHSSRNSENNLARLADKSGADSSMEAAFDLPRFGVLQ